MPAMDSGLADSVVLITGAAGGIGSAMARAFAHEGASPVLHHHRGAAAAAALARELGPRALALQADLREEGETDAMMERAVRSRGRVDALVVNHGIWVAEPVPIHQMSSAQWRCTVATNLESAFLVCRAFFRHLAHAPRQGASVVLVASTAALFGEADHADYSASKAALAYGLTRSLKNEIVRLAPRGRVNCICPGWTATPMAAPGTSDARLMRRVFATMPLRRIATAEEVAAAAVFLTSPALAGHISGAILPIAGGMEGRMLWESEA
jgi:3-oxoacyl-[acyl-carrier protein] reductase